MAVWRMTVQWLCGVWGVSGHHRVRVYGRIGRVGQQ